MADETLTAPNISVVAQILRLPTADMAPVVNRKRVGRYPRGVVGLAAYKWDKEKLKFNARMNAKEAEREAAACARREKDAAADEVVKTLVAEIDASLAMSVFELAEKTRNGPRNTRQVYVLWHLADEVLTLLHAAEERLAAAELEMKHE